MKQIILIILFLFSNLSFSLYKGQDKKFLDAVYKGDKEKVSAALSLIPNFHKRTILSRGALHMAAAFGRLAVIELLLDTGVNVNIKDVQDQTALHFAANKGHLASVDFLLSRGADIDAKQKYWGETAFHLAVANGYESVVKFLKKSGADTSIASDSGATALHISVRNQQNAVARFLLEHGSDTEAKDKNGMTALSYDYSNHAMIKLFRRWPRQVEQARQKTINLRVQAIAQRRTGLGNLLHNRLPDALFRELVLAIKVEPKTTDPLPKDK